MKLQPVEQIAVYFAPGPERRLKVGRLARRDRQILFEYDASFLGSGLELSPVHLKLKPGVMIGDSALFEGLMGLFDDSLPDGWGRLLIDRRAAELGISARTLTPLDRLALVGARSMGALVYEPEVDVEDPSVIELAELARETEKVLENASGPDLDRLIAIGGSPKGARPKVLVQIATNGELRVGAKTIDPGASAWMVKFRCPGDDVQSAALEHAYFLMAKAAGITVPRTQVLGRTKKHAGYFAIERFDRSGSERVHMHTVGGLLNLPYGYSALDYEDLLRVTRQLTRSDAEVAEMFRRACFNVFAHNRDDHSRNFAFLMDERGEWRLSPAYDLTYTDGPGGEHTTLVEGEGRNPGESHLLRIGESQSLKSRAGIVDEVRSAVGRFGDFADEAGVPSRLKKKVAAVLAASRSSG